MPNRSTLLKFLLVIHLLFVQLFFYADYLSKWLLTDNMFEFIRKFLK